MRILLTSVLLLQFFVLEASAQLSSPPKGFEFDYGRWPYPLNEEVGAELAKLARENPDIARIHVIGKTREGRKLTVMEITNIKTGPGITKPGMWMDGNVHAGEITGRPYLRYFIKRLIASYGKDPKITHLIDTRTFYVLPVFDADGGDRMLTRHPAWPGHNPINFLGKDLDGDGYITQIRTKDPSQPDGYRYYLESPDVRPGENWPGAGTMGEFMNRRRRNPVTGEREGPDFNRNWSAEWEPQEPGAGPRPFALPEVEAVADFIISHKNIYFVYSIHSGGGARSYMVRPPMNEPYETMPPEDNDFYVRVGAIWSYLSQGGIMENNYYSFLFNTSVVDPQTGKQRGYSKTMVGFMNDWAYMHEGLHSILPEINGSAPDYNGDGWIVPDEEERWAREEKGGQYFSPWTPYHHPKLGDVEIGGSRGIPPALDGTLKLYCEEQFDFLTHIAGLAPILKVKEIKPERVSRGKYRVVATVRNEGWLSTYITRKAIEIRRDLPALAEIEVSGGEVEGEPLKKVGHVLGKLAYIGRMDDDSEESDATVEWTVNASGSEPVEITVRTWAPKAGRDSKTIVIER